MSAASSMILAAVREMTANERSELRVLLDPPTPLSEKVLELMTVEEAARRAACHVETIRRAIRVGRLHASRIGSRWRVSPDDLQTWMSAAEPAGRQSGSTSRRARRHSRPSTVSDAWEALKPNK